MPTILDTILEHKRHEVSTAAQAIPLAEMRARAAAALPPRSFAAALRPPGPPGDGPPRLIAEIKRKSPSQGAIATNVDVSQLAASYERAGAAALSVLTDARFFGGSLADLTAARAATSLPVLRKDFIIAPYQVHEARAAGADAILVIVAAVPEVAGVAELIAEAHALGMATLVEVHTQSELTVAGQAGARIIGVNNRDLKTFDENLATTELLAPLIPDEAILVSESGVHTAADVRRLARAGADALLVGTSLLASGDPAAKVKELLA